MAKPMRTDGQSRSRQQTLRGANDNAVPGEACVTDAGTVVPVEELSQAELLVLTPLINALARLAAKRLSATTISTEEF